MSKSTGNVVDPFQILEIYGTDSVRWYLARIGGNFVDDVGEASFNGLGGGLIVGTRLVGRANDKASQP